VKHTDDSGGLGFILNHPGAEHAAVASEEGREVDGAIAAIGKCAYTNALGLEIFESARDVEEALASGADDRDGCSSQLGEIG
jgi:hypothetical protein